MVHSQCHENKNLIFNFIRRDVRIKCVNSIRLYLDNIITIVIAGVYYFVFTIIASETELYPIWVLIGVITWQFFSRSLNGSITSISEILE